ncbi:type VI secretion system-associated FHA domain protein TagH [Kangiella spongicola]|uniref:Type VI secretion system-associated FHA domain protein TagH n=1 Tax=Kangiella spongicola TaxID=796379 RepID=A0A318DDI3_9GAMM|nr:type VI secretion system-associated FHA domain protein TagH [Kangiella spongicola]PXF64209.1 type VI secretion system-associated FHA domain protein TagH [Kangiella spongicola]
MSILKLKVTSYHRLTPGQVVEQIFGEQGGSIGRSAKSDWVLPDPDKVISSVHAYISYQSGQYYITDNSTNGLFVNRSVQPLGKGNSQSLADGDYLQLGDYEIEVAVEAQSVAPQPVPAGSQAYATPAPAASSEPIPTNSIDQIASQQSHFEAVSQDPFAENFAPPMAQIPEDWDATQQSEAAETAMPKETLEQSVPPRVSPASEQPVQQRVQEQAQAAPAQPVSQQAQGFEQAASTPVPPSPPPVAPSTPTSAPAPAPQQHYRQEAPMQPQAPAAPAPIAATNSSFDSISDEQAKQFLTSFLNAAGLREEDLPRDVSPALFEAMGGALRFSLQGMLDILRARSDMKSEFRVLQTTIRTQENNPLKFSINVDEAIRNLFLRQVPGFLPWFQAIESCFKDMSSHELALMAGTQGAIQGLLDTLNPEEISKANQSDSALHKVLPATKKAKLWDMFVALHQESEKELGQGSEKTFSEEFAAAYEAQLKKLGAS